MIDIEARVTESLRADAERTPSSAHLHDRAVARARTIRRRRRVVAAAGATALAAAGLLLVPHPGTSQHVTVPGPSPVHTRAASPPGPTTLPEVTGVPTAADRPTVLGTDPAVLHFDLNLAAIGGTASQWTSHTTFESVQVATGSGDPHNALQAPPLEVFVGSDQAKLEAGRTPPGDYVEVNDGTRYLRYDQGPRQPTTVGDLPATLQKITNDGVNRVTHVPPTSTLDSDLNVNYSPTYGPTAWVLRWQPADGIWAIIELRAPDSALAYAAASALRLDHAQRCAVPGHLTDVPAGARLAACQTLVRTAPSGPHGVWLASSVTIALPDGTSAGVTLEEVRPHKPIDLAQFHPNRTVAGHPAEWFTDQPGGLWVLQFGAAEVFVGGVPEAVALRLAGGLRIADDLAHPGTWPGAL